MRLLNYFGFLVGLSGLVACAPAPTETELAGMAQGTTYHIKFVSTPDLDNSALQREIDAKLAEIDAQLSNYRNDSEIARFNQQNISDWQNVSPALPYLVDIAMQVHGKTRGCYDLTVKPLLEAWGFFKHEGVIPDEATLNTARAKVGLTKIAYNLDEPKLRKLDVAAQIDYSSIGQGYAIGQIAKLLESRGLMDYLVEIGGEMQVRGHKANGKPWRVAIEKPVPERREVQRIVEVPPERVLAIMTSGSYRNYFASGGKIYSHIVDPATGKPVDHHLLSVSVLHPDPTWADAWSTALLCLGEIDGPQVAEREGLEALFIYGEAGQLKEILSSKLSQETWVGPNLP